MEFHAIVHDISYGLLVCGLERPLSVTISTFDIDVLYFLETLYDPAVQYDIWYWYATESIGGSMDLSRISLPSNVRLHHLDHNHAKFWYIETETTARLVVTSANLTYGMMHNCLQALAIVTAPRSRRGSTTGKMAPFFGIYGITLDTAIAGLLENRLVFNIPGHYNGIEKWLAAQKSLVIDSNNVTFTYLPSVPKKIIARTDIPQSATRIVAYYSTERRPPSTVVEHVQYAGMFHHKLYYTDKSLLLSSSNFSYSHKSNYELGILIDE